MTSKYTVIQFTPDLVTGEIVNVGLIVWDVGGRLPTVGKALYDWSRVNAFAGRTCSHVLTHVRALIAEAGLLKTEEEIRALGWPPYLEITPGRFSMLLPEQTLQNLAPCMLKGNQ